jgi:hypothetical protein
MRVLFSAMIASLLIALAGAASTSDAQNAPNTAPVRSQPAAAAGGTNADNDAAARHAKRTACIKEARAKKLVGAQKTAYIKDCAAAR